MQLHNDPEATTSHEHNERTGYMGSSQNYEPSSNQEFQQQRYDSPYGSSFYHQQPFVGTSPFSDSHFAAILSYSFGWLTGLLFMLFGGRDRFMRFHALQSLVFFGTINLIDFGLFTMMIGERHHSFILLFVCLIFVSVIELHCLCELDRCYGSGWSWCVLQIAFCGRMGCTTLQFACYSSLVMFSFCMPVRLRMFVTFWRGQRRTR